MTQSFSGSSPSASAADVRRFGCGAVDLAHEGGRRQREGVADDARQPLVELVLVRRLRKSLVGRSARRPDEARARRGIAREHAVEPFLKLPDLLGVPAFGSGQQPGRHVALVKCCSCIVCRRSAMLTVMTICSTGPNPYALCGRGLRGR